MAEHPIQVGGGVVAVRIVRERGDDAGWWFDAEVERDGVVTRHAVRLAWADYNLWSPAGTDRPEHVAAAVLEFLTTVAGDIAPPGRFDAASVRMRHPEADREIPGLIGHARDERPGSPSGV